MNALRHYRRFKNGKEIEQLELAARRSGDALTACERLEENFLATRLHVATEYALYLEVSGDASDTGRDDPDGH